MKMVSVIGTVWYFSSYNNIGKVLHLGSVKIILNTLYNLFNLFNPKSAHKNNKKTPEQIIVCK